MLYAIVAMLAIIADQWVKYWCSQALPWESVGEKFIPGIMSLVYVQNDGAAFGILSGSGARIYFIILTGVFTVAVILALATNFISNPLGRWSIVMMTAGGLANCIDRVIYGYVQDMFKLELFNFPVFNVADIFITVFCLLFVISIIFGSRDSGYDDEFEEEDDEEEDRPRREKKEKEPKEKPEKKPRMSKKAKYEDEYEQYKAARAARQEAEPQPQPKRAPAYDAADPFAEWEKANAKAGNQPREYAAPQPTAPQRAPQAQPQRPAAPQQAPVRPAAPAPVQRAPQAQPPRPAAPQQAPVQRTPAAPQPASAPKKSSDAEFSLDDILAEFK